MRRFWLGLFIFLSLTWQGVSPIKAASLLFEPSTINVPVGETQKVELKVDPKGVEIISTDAWIRYDPKVVSIKKDSAGKYEIQQGNLFQKMNFNLVQPGKLYIYGILNDVNESRNAMDTMSIINFEIIGSGNSEVTFDCEIGLSESSKVVKNDINATNIIECAGNGSLMINPGSSSTGSNSNNNPAQPPPQANVDEQMPLEDPYEYQQAQQSEVVYRPQPIEDPYAGQQPAQEIYTQQVIDDYIPEAGSIGDLAVALGLGGALTVAGVYLHHRLQ